MNKTDIFICLSFTAIFIGLGLAGIVAFDYEHKALANKTDFIMLNQPLVYENIKATVHVDTKKIDEPVVKENLSTEKPLSKKIDSEIKTEKISSEKNLGSGWYLSQYYTPSKNQTNYFDGNYTNDYYMNCQGDCTVTASGYKLKPEDRYQVVACPPEIGLGTELKITLPSDHAHYPNKTWRVSCQDRGGAIKNKKIDLYSGQSAHGVNDGHPDSVWIGEMSTHNATISIINK